MPDARYQDPACYCGDPWCAGCEEADQERFLEESVELNKLELRAEEEKAMSTYEKGLEPC